MVRWPSISSFHPPIGIAAATKLESPHFLPWRFFLLRIQCKRRVRGRRKHGRRIHGGSGIHKRRIHGTCCCLLDRIRNGSWRWWRIRMRNWVLLLFHTRRSIQMWIDRVLLRTRWRLQIRIDCKHSRLLLLLFLLLCCCTFRTGAPVVVLIRKLLESLFSLVQIFREKALAIVLWKLFYPLER